MVYSFGLNKGFGLKFWVVSQFQQETPEESQKMHEPKHCEYNNKDEDSSQSTRNDENYHASSKKNLVSLCLTL